MDFCTKFISNVEQTLQTTISFLQTTTFDKEQERQRITSFHLSSMKILYAIQGTGNGHIVVAKDLLPRLKELAEVDILISGCQVDIELPYEIKYRYNGLGFVFGKSGGIDYWETYKKGNLKKFYKEVTELNVGGYDIVISDFEPVSAWACYLKKVPCLGLSHQAAVVHKKSPKAEKMDVIGKAVLKYYAPTKTTLGFHYQAYDAAIQTPIIRQEIREQKLSNKKHYTVYLPAFSDKKIIQLLSLFRYTQWEVFSKHSKLKYKSDNVRIIPVNNQAFIDSMASAEGVLCGAGFQTPAEVLFMKKKLLVVPMKGQYEQQCNAVALKEMGVPVIKSMKTKHYQTVKSWLDNKQEIKVDFPDIADKVVARIIATGKLLKIEQTIEKDRQTPEFSVFRKRVLSKIFEG
jgi:uncharacterized protein (TIGR00661 family)